MFSLIPLNIVWKGPVSTVWHTKEIKFEKEETKLSLFLDGMSVYVGNSKESKKIPYWN